MATPTGPIAGTGVLFGATGALLGIAGVLDARDTTGVIVETDAGFAGLLADAVFGGGFKDWTRCVLEAAAADAAAGAEDSETGRAVGGTAAAFATGAMAAASVVASPERETETETAGAADAPEAAALTVGGASLVGSSGTRDNS